MKLQGYNPREVTRDEIKSFVGPGWGKLIDELLDDLKLLDWDGNVHQVKEKFGGLRFYIGSGSPEVHERIEQAERDSESICEDCGAPGKIRNRPWLKTLCDECND